MEAEEEAEEEVTGPSCAVSLFIMHGACFFLVLRVFPPHALCWRAARRAFLGACSRHCCCCCAFTALRTSL